MIPMIGLMIGNYIAVRMIYIVMRKEEYHTEAARTVTYVVAVLAFAINLVLARFLLISGVGVSTSF